MEATAIKRFTATIGARAFDCESGDKVEADAKTIEQLEAIGLVTTKIKGGEPRKAENDD